MSSPRGGDQLAIPSTGRVLGVDPGEVRVGLAVTDPEQRIATAAETLDAGPATTGDEADLDELASRVAGACDRLEIVGIVVGLPRTLAGRETRAAHRARDLADGVGARTGLPVELWDERFTTSEAERVMIEQGTRRRARRQAVDRVAATLILQGWLERRRRGRD